ncbi:MAG: hypothetical protein K2F81_00465 [Ruminococcus sp.]|nr:hypothetical protein [Ruminococcus sp.]
MDIQVISKSCVKIIITKEEADNFEICFDNFEKDNPETKTFLGYILAVIDDIGIINSSQDKISVEIFEQERGDLIIYISSSPHEDESKNELFPAMICSKDPLEIINFLESNKFSYLIIKESTKLFFCDEIYCLTFNCTNNSDLPENIIFDEALIAKTKEYGRIICNTPFETLI